MDKSAHANSETSKRLADLHHVSAWVANEPAQNDRPFLIDIDGFEGPLDLLLQLARNQKVDLMHISVVALVDQYLLFMQNMHRLRLEIAADYLVMAAWLTYLKSRLLIPELPSDPEPSGEGMAEYLQFRLRRLEAMREAAGKLLERDHLGREIFARGAPEGTVPDRKYEISTTLYELLIAYAAIQQKNAVKSVSLGQRSVLSLKTARQLLANLAMRRENWTSLDHYLDQFNATAPDSITVKASIFAASLELVREGRLELRQNQPFTSLYLRAKTSDNAQ